MAGFDLMLKGVVYQKGSSFNSYCLDVDVSAKGNSIEEARENLIRAVSSFSSVENSCLMANFLSSGMDAGLSNDYASFVDEFYFKQNFGVLGNTIIDDLGAADTPGDEADEEKYRIISITGRDE